MYKYLWNDREVPSILSRRWFRVWIKRAYYMPRLARIAVWAARVRVRGVGLGRLTIAYPFHLEGPGRNLQIGAECFIARTVLVATHGRVSIGDRVAINDGVRILTASHDVRSETWARTVGDVSIGDHAWIATGAILLPGVRIGRGAVVGAGAVVSRDLPDYAVAIGNPAVVVEDKRCRGLDYSPVALAAPYEAWFGPGHTNGGPRRG